MAVWVVRAGRMGEWEEFDLENNIVTINWEEIPDLNHVSNREDVVALYRERYPGKTDNSVRNSVGQIWAFCSKIQIADLVVLPLKARSAIAIGKITGPYQYRSDFPLEVRHARSVEWLNKSIPRAAFDQDILYSFGSFMTVCQIQRNHAEERIRAVLAGKTVTTMHSAGNLESEILADIGAPLDIEQYGRDQVQEYLGQKFRGHDLSRLVAKLLEV